METSFQTCSERQRILEGILFFFTAHYFSLLGDQVSCSISKTISQSQDFFSSHSRKLTFLTRLSVVHPIVFQRTFWIISKETFDSVQTTDTVGEIDGAVRIKIVILI